MFWNTTRSPWKLCFGNTIYNTSLILTDFQKGEKLIYVFLFICNLIELTPYSFIFCFRLNEIFLSQTQLLLLVRLQTTTTDEMDVTTIIYFDIQQEQLICPILTVTCFTFQWHFFFEFLFSTLRHILVIHKEFHIFLKQNCSKIFVFLSLHYENLPFVIMKFLIVHMLI